MLTPRGYTTISQIQNYLLHTIKDYFKPQVEEWIAQMESFVDKETGRNFIADVAATTKKYQVEEQYTVTVGRYLKVIKQLFIKDCIEITELKIDDVVISTDNYLTYPSNSLPITRVKLKDDVSDYFPAGEQNIEVKAKWGYSEVCPYDISFATMIFAVGIINFSGQMEGEIKSEKIGDYQVAYKDKTSLQDFERAKQILQQYKKTVI